MVVEIGLVARCLKYYELILEMTKLYVDKCYFIDYISTSNPNVSSANQSANQSAKQSANQSANQINTRLQDIRGDCGQGTIAFMYIVSGVFGVLMCCFIVIAYVVAKKYANLDLTTYLLK